MVEKTEIVKSFNLVKELKKFKGNQKNNCIPGTDLFVGVGSNLWNAIFKNFKKFYKFYKFI